MKMPEAMEHAPATNVTEGSRRRRRRWAVLAAVVAALAVPAWLLGPQGLAPGPASAATDPTTCVSAAPGPAQDHELGTYLTIEYANDCSESFLGGAALVTVLDDTGTAIEDGISNLPALSPGDRAADEVLFQRDISAAAKIEVTIQRLW